MESHVDLVAHRTLPRWPVAVGALFWLAAVTYGSFVPLNYRAASWEETWERARQIPWLSIGVSGRADWVANGALFFPAAVLVAAALSWNSGTLGRAVAAVGAGLFMSAWAVGVEVAQIWFPTRTLSRNDILSEIIGSCCGALTWACFAPEIRATLHQLLYSRGRAWVRHSLAVFTLALIAYGIFPGDLVVNRAEFAAKVEMGRVSWGWHDYKAIVFAAASFAPVGVWISLRHRGTYESAGLMIGLPVLYEALQLATYTRTAALAHLLAGVAGALGGASLTYNDVAERWIVERRMPRGLLAALMVVVTLGYWYPLDFADSAVWTSRLVDACRAPFSAHYYGAEFQVLNNMLIRVVAFGLPGVMLMLGVARRSVAWMVGLVVWAPLVELGQVALVDKIPDVGDAVLNGVFVVVGMWVGRWRSGGGGDGGRGDGGRGDGG